MSGLDINSKVRVLRSLSPAASTTDRNGAAVALNGAAALMLSMAVGAVTTLDDTNKYTLKCFMGPDTDIANATEVDADAYLHPRTETGAAWLRILNLAFAGADRCYQVGIVNKRGDAYAFAQLIKAASPSAIIGVDVILGTMPQSPNPAP